MQRKNMIYRTNYRNFTNLLYKLKLERIKYIEKNIIRISFLFLFKNLWIPIHDITMTTKWTTWSNICYQIQEYLSYVTEHTTFPKHHQTPEGKIQYLKHRTSSTKQSNFVKLRRLTEILMSNWAMFLWSIREVFSLHHRLFHGSKPRFR